MSLTLVPRLEDYSTLVNKAKSGYNKALYEENGMMVYDSTRRSLYLIPT